MKFFDLTKHNKRYKKEILKKISEIIDDSNFIGGKEVLEFEKKLVKVSKTKYAVALDSGTHSLYLSLIALGIGKGDEVITTPFTFIATAESIVRVGAKPVFVDITEDFNIDVSQIEKAITKKTKAILPVHLFGRMCDMTTILEIAQKYKLYVLEDACQAIGERIKGDIGCFSFYPTKNLSAFGDGGAMVTNNKEIYDKIVSLRSHGSSKKDKYSYNVFGMNSRMDVIQASILNIKIKDLKIFNKKRIEIAKEYNKGLRDVKEVILPKISKCSFHQYTLLAKDRNKLIKSLDKNDIAYNIYYPKPLHLQKVFSGKKGNFLVSESISEVVISLPIYPEFKEYKKVINKIREFYGY